MKNYVVEVQTQAYPNAKREDHLVHVRAENKLEAEAEAVTDLAYQDHFRVVVVDVAEVERWELSH